jgi:hypothetical protein
MKMGPIGSIETSKNNNQPALLNFREERKFRLHGDQSLQSVSQSVSHRHLCTVEQWPPSHPVRLYELWATYCNQSVSQSQALVYCGAVTDVTSCKVVWIVGHIFRNPHVARCMNFFFKNGGEFQCDTILKHGTFYLAVGTIERIGYGLYRARTGRFPTAHRDMRLMQ